VNAGVAAVDTGLARQAAPWAGAQYANARANAEWRRRGNDGLKSRLSANRPPLARCTAA
jgi:hypothetical protein